MKWIDWNASPRRIAEQILVLALLGGAVLGGIVGFWLRWAISH